MEREALWISEDQRTCEHLRLSAGESGEIIADGWIIHAGDNSYRIHYRIQSDKEWRVRMLRMTSDDNSADVLALQSDGAGNWTDLLGRAVTPLKGCIDVDIFASPFTNTLAIRRLRLKKDGSQTIRVAYVSLPDLIVTPVDQRYTLLRADAQGQLYRYEGLQSGFTVELPVDRDGLVTDYPGYFKRVWAR